MELKQIFGPINEELTLVEEVLEKQLKQIWKENSAGIHQYDFAYRAVNHLFLNAGKRLRPALVLLSAKSLQDPGVSINGSLIHLAAAVELIHSASLVHDDVIDETEYRRKQSTLNTKYGSKIAVLAGDILYSQFFSLLTELEIMNQEKKIKLFQIFCEVTKKMCLGEICEQDIIRRKINPDLQEYLDILENKTANLMSACCQCGAMLNGADAEEVRSLTDFGLHFGLAYQLIDDHNDNDALLADDIDTIELAKENIAKAKDNIGFLNESEPKRMLLSLCRYILRLK